MAEKYPVPCACGAAIQVKLTDAGLTLPCTACGGSIIVPSSAKLKESSGDRRPFLSPYEKVRQAFFAHEPPFDGVCHHCSSAKATHHTPITVSALADRAEIKRATIRPTIGGIQISTPTYEETWESLTFPLLLCDDCQSKFVEQRTQSSPAWPWLAAFAGLGLVGLALFLLFGEMAVISLLSLVFAGAFYGFFVWRMLPPKVQRGDWSIRPWISRIRWVPELIDTGGEMAISVGRSQRLLP